MKMNLNDILYLNGVWIGVFLNKFKTFPNIYYLTLNFSQFVLLVEYFPTYTTTLSQ